jgi:hypothetical protein
MMPRTEAGRALGVTVENELGLQFKTPESYQGWLRTADSIAVRIEAEAAETALLDRAQYAPECCYLRHEYEDGICAGPTEAARPLTVERLAKAMAQTEVNGDPDNMPESFFVPWATAILRALEADKE